MINIFLLSLTSICLIVVLQIRYPQKSLLDSFYVLAMRTINRETDVDRFGCEELEQLLDYYGEEQVLNRCKL